MPDRSDCFLAGLPPDLGHLLAIGTMGAPHLLRVARAAMGLLQGGTLGQDAPLVLGLARDLLCLAWSEAPDNGSLAVEALAMGGRFGRLLPPLPGGLRVALAEAAQGRVPEDEDEFVSLAAGGDQAATAAHVLERLARTNARDPALRFWLGRLFWHGGLAGQWEAVAAALRDYAPNPDEPGLLLMRGQAALHGNDPAEAVSLLERAEKALAEPWLLSCLAEARAAAGQASQAVDLYGRAVAARPWHVHALLRLGSLALGNIGPGRLDGPCVVNLYTWNKAADLARTLDSLRRSRLGAAAGRVLVRVLDNGSSDDTGQVLDRAAQDFGPLDLDRVILPVNVGAPAARNWLVRLALDQGFDWVAFLDDDVLLPLDWLERLAGATQARPQAGVWGCRVVEAAVPTLVQHADEFLLPLADQGAGLEISDFNGHHHDYGRSAYDRHAAMVMGCCHLFRAADLAAAGPFEINLSPSQYDDVDHDLRLLDMGKPAFCLGSLAVAHARGMGPLSPPKPLALALSEANKAKLAALHAGRMHGLLAAQRAMLMRDLAGLCNRLGQAGLVS